MGINAGRLASSSLRAATRVELSASNEPISVAAACEQGTRRRDATDSAEVSIHAPYVIRNIWDATRLPQIWTGVERGLVLQRSVPAGLRAWSPLARRQKGWVEEGVLASHSSHSAPSFKSGASRDSLAIFVRGPNSPPPCGAGHWLACETGRQQTLVR